MKTTRIIPATLAIALLAACGSGGDAISKAEARKLLEPHVTTTVAAPEPEPAAVVEVEPATVPPTEAPTTTAAPTTTTEALPEVSPEILWVLSYSDEIIEIIDGVTTDSTTLADAADTNNIYIMQAACDVVLDKIIDTLDDPVMLDPSAHKDFTDGIKAWGFGVAACVDGDLDTAIDKIAEATATFDSFTAWVQDNTPS